MYDPSRTPPLVVIDGARRPGRPQLLHIPASDRLDQFVGEAASHGVDAALAIRLGLERALLLLDAQDLGFGVEPARALLGIASNDARVSAALGPGEARYVRLLNCGRPAMVSAKTKDGIDVALPGRILMRTRGRVRPDALDTGSLPEMLSWERAAVLSGRSMGAWGLFVLGRSLRV